MSPAHGVRDIFQKALLGICKAVLILAHTLDRRVQPMTLREKKAKYLTSTDRETVDTVNVNLFNAAL